MIGLDTNILIRYLTKDDEVQWQQAATMIEAGETCFISDIVLCEIVWVLEGKSYRYSKQEILETLELILQSPTFEFEDRSVIYQALQQTKQGKADFSDYLIGAISASKGCRTTISFDRKLNQEQNFLYLS